MGLLSYWKKRSFKKTPEPKGKIKKLSSKDQLHFCVQKHDATRLHYDFRLECQGVLLSWAVPKGPSLDPKDKRLAIHVEDHPYDYREFEGTIPPGNYGAGTVMLWDEGTFTVPEATNKKDAEKILAQGMQKGHIEFDLDGKKLKGRFVLVKIKTQDDKDNWLLFKKADQFASKDDVTEEDLSVKTARSLDEIANNTKAKKNTNKKAKKSARMPTFIKPMLCTLIDEPFDDASWLFEIKFDGYRALSFIEDGTVNIYSRNEKSFNKQFSAIADDLSKIDAQVILDGEIVVLDENGRSRFQLMQNYQQNQKGDLVYYVFDILFLDGQDLRTQPLIERKKILKDFLQKQKLSLTFYSDDVIGKGKEFFKAASKKNLEGIVGKKIDSAYLSRRTTNWVKIKTHARQEAIICGFTEPRHSRKHFGALLLGVYNEKNELVYIGHVGGGFDGKTLKAVYEKMEPLIQDKSPFAKKIKTNMKPTWIKPKLVCEIRFAEWTDEGIVRQPVFQGLRIDKKPNEVHFEMPKIVEEEKNESENAISNPQKIFWPKHHYTKEDLLNYYRSVTKYILPFLKDRPLMLHRFPEGVEGKNFYQKDSSMFNLPKEVKTTIIHQEDKDNRYILVNNKETLDYVVNLGSLELHAFLARYESLLNPDFLLIDLDPVDIGFGYVVEVAQAFHKILKKIGVESFCKTSGKRGLHICIPMGAKYTFEQTRQFGLVLAMLVHQQLPEITSLERMPNKRKKKVYLDVLQNNKGQTMVAPYSLRPTEDATVSTPLKWSEVKKGLDPTEFTLKTVPARLKRVGDLFAGVLCKKGVNVVTALKKLNDNF